MSISHKYTPYYNEFHSECQVFLVKNSAFSKVCTVRTEISHAFSFFWQFFHVIRIQIRLYIYTKKPPVRKKRCHSIKKKQPGVLADAGLQFAQV